MNNLTMFARIIRMYHSVEPYRYNFKNILKDIKELNKWDIYPIMDRKIKNDKEVFVFSKSN